MLLIMFIRKRRRNKTIREYNFYETFFQHIILMNFWFSTSSIVNGEELFVDGEIAFRSKNISNSNVTCSEQGGWNHGIG